MQPKVLVLGAGPAGLSAAYELSKHGVKSIVLEADSVVGGIARTVEHNGFLFDIGGHRFFTKLPEVEKMWFDILGDDFLTRPRQSRIYFHEKFYDYPFNFYNVIQNLGLAESFLCGASYLWNRCFPTRPEPDFETWVSNRFGKRLFRMFFESYTEKVWGMSCKEIRAEWAAQRIRDLSFWTALKHALVDQRGKPKEQLVKTLIHEFHYPRRGPGMMWERTRDRLVEAGSEVILDAPVTRIDWPGGKVASVTTRDGRRYQADHVISSLPIRCLIGMLHPAAPELSAVADRFRYRDFLTVALIVKRRDLFPDNWIYIHEPDVKVGRIQNFKNWSPDMTPDPEYTCIGLEYFCFEGDDLWTMSDDALIALAKRESAKLGLVDPKEVTGGAVVRMPKAYPVYDGGYQEGLAAVRRFLERVPNLQLVGRNGMHHYNNQDHSMWTGMLAARNILGENHDLWQVNADQEYHEETSDAKAARLLRGSQPIVPRAVAPDN